jgi:hypothetical protein
MTGYDLYDTIVQSDLNDIIDALLANFHYEETISLTTMETDYATLTVDWNGNQSSESEYIVTNPFTINYTNPKYVGIGYSLRIEYYDLSDGDIDDTEDLELQSKIIELEDGDNTISFTEDTVYLQQEATLIITNEEVE